MAAGNTGSEQKYSDLESTEKSLWPEKRTETLASGSSASSEHACHLPVDPHDEASITRVPRGRLVTHQIIKEIVTELSQDLELKSSEVTTKPTRYLGRTLEQRRRRTRCFACGRHAGGVHRVRAQKVHQHCDENAVRQMRRRSLQANKESTDSLLKN